MELTFETGTLLLLIAVVVAILTRRLRLPYSVGLVAAGAVLASVPVAATIPLTRELLFSALLPPLLYEAALNIGWRDLRRDLAPIVLLATVGVVLSAAVTAAGMHWAAGWPWSCAAIFGVLIAATDPVSVIATFKESGATGRLRLLIESESLLNDGTAAVAFGVVVAFGAGQSATPAQAGLLLVKTVAGGLGCGALVGLAALLLMGRTEDHLVELTVSAIAAYGSFLLAEHWGLSGVLATIAAGLVMGNCQAVGRVTERGREALENFWEFAAFLANSLVFLLIGLHVSARELLRVHWVAAAAILFVLAGRAAAVYPCCLFFAGTERRISFAHQHVLFWGGLRGALALALALGLPTETPLRESIIAVSFAVVAFSVFVQGVSVAPLLRRIGELPARR